MTRVCALTSIAFLSTLTLSACLAVADDGDPAVLSEGPTRRAPRPAFAPRAAHLGLTIAPTMSRLPDGRTAIDVSGVRAGGLDPVLHVGDDVVRDYVYVRPGVARFITDVAPATTIRVSYGDAR